jgi:hypothetical protein
MWALPFWAILIVTHFVRSFYTFVQDTISFIILPGFLFCLWLAGGIIHSIDYNCVMFSNLFIYYAAMLLILFVIDRFRGPRRSRKNVRRTP